jgi:hypothetical protein
MAIAQPDYVSGSLTIDSLGFRQQYDLAGDLIDLETAKEKYPRCTVLLGNSTSFGVSLSHDRKTLGHWFGEPDCPCINLSVRGATMQQELATFLTFKHLLPRPERIVLLTGVCDISLSVQPEDFAVPAAGGMHSMSNYARQYVDRIAKFPDPPTQTKKLFLETVENFYLKHVWLQKVLQRTILKGRKLKPAPVMSAALVSEKLDSIFSVLANVMETWNWVQRAQGIAVDVVLQPIAGWTRKPPTPDERACIAADDERIPLTKMYANHGVYEQVSNFYRQKCSEYGLRFIDVNPYFEHPSLEDQTLFSDFCHLTDNGTAVLGAYLRDQLFSPDVRNIGYPSGRV